MDKNIIKAKILRDVENRLIEGSKYADIVKGRILSYRKYYSDNGAETISGDRSSYRSKAIQKEFSKIIPAITEPILSNDKLFCSSGNPREDKAVELLNYQWNYLLNKNRIINEAVNNYVIDGTALIKSEWELVTEIKKKKSLLYSSNREEVLEVASKVSEKDSKKILDEYNTTGKAPIGVRKEDEEIIVSNMPKIKTVNPTNVVIDPKAKNLKDARFLIEQYEIAYKDILNHYRLYNSSVNIIREAFINSDTYSTYDLERFSLSNQNTNIENMVDMFISEYEDLANKKVTAYEYWGEISEDGIKVENKVVTWVGSTIIRYSDNPYAHQSIPYSSGAYNYSNDTIFGESDSALSVNDQTGLSRIMRVLDNASISAENNQEFIETGFLPDITQQQNYLKKKTVFFKKGADPRKSIYKNSIESLPDNVSYLKDVYSKQISDTLSFSPDYINNNNEVEDPVGDREMSKLRNFLALLSDVGSKIMSMNEQFIIDDTTIHDEDGSEINIKPDELVCPNGVIFAKAISRRERKISEDRLVKLMSTQASNMTPKIASLHYVELAKLFGKNKLAKAIELEIEQMDKPNPAQELEMERLKLENAKIQLEMKRLDAEANQMNAKAEENIAKAVERYITVKYGVAKSERDFNEARVRLAGSQANKFNAQTELFNQEFNLISSGAKQEQEDARIEFQHQANLEREKIRTDRELELNDKSHKQALEQKDREAKPKEGINPLLEYIKSGTLKNSSYDAVDDVYRNIRQKNSTNTEQYTGGIYNVNDERHKNL